MMNSVTNRYQVFRFQESEVRTTLEEWKGTNRLRTLCVIQDMAVLADKAEGKLNED